MARKYFLPPGSRDIFEEEGERLWKIEEDLTLFFYQKGLSRVYPPLLEYLDVFSTGIGKEKEKKTYKLLDPSSGKFLVLRSDITPQIARLWWSLKNPEDFGVFYFEKIVRIEDEFSGMEREIFQGGVELLNYTKGNLELNLLLLLKETLKLLGIKDFKLVVGSSKIVSYLSKKYPGIVECFEKRDLSCLEKGEVPPYFIEGVLTPDRINPKTFPEEISSLLYELEEVVSPLKLDSRIIIDPFLFPPSSYYTGIIFKVIASSGEEIVVGGRYDQLLEKFGRGSPAAGFAINLFKLLPAVSNY